MSDLGDGWVGQHRAQCRRHIFGSQIRCFREARVAQRNVARLPRRGGKSQTHQRGVDGSGAGGHRTYRHAASVPNLHGKRVQLLTCLHDPVVLRGCCRRRRVLRGERTESQR